MKTKLRFLTLLLISIMAANQFAYAQLSGPRSIGGASPDYATFTDAINDLTTLGVSGPVIFNVAAEAFNEKIFLTNITGASAANTISFIGIDSLQTFIYDSLISDTGIVNISGAKHIIFKNIGIKAISESTSHGYCVKFHANSDSVTFEKCHFSRIGGMNIPGSQNIYSGFAHTGLNFIKNAFDGINAGIEISTSTDTTRNLHIEGNVFKDFNYAAINLTRTKNSTIINNKASIIGDGYLMRLYNSKIVDISTNIFDAKSGGVGIWIDYCDTVSIYNNLIKIGYSQAPSYAVGINSYYSSNLKVYHNTIKNECSYGFYDLAGIVLSGNENTVFVHNNIISCTQGAYALKAGAISAWSNYDYNNFYTTDIFKVFVGNGMDTSMLNGNLSNLSYDNPALSSGEIMTPMGCSLPFGTNLQTDVVNDFNGAVRPINPSLGAIEFIPGSSIAGGDILVGKAETYKTLSDALTVLQSCGDLTSTVRILLTDSIYKESSQIIIDTIKGLSATNRLIIKPNVGVKAKIHFENLNVESQLVIKIDYVTIDGSNTLNGTTRDLEILAPPLYDAFGSLLYLQYARTNIDIKNTILTGVIGTSENIFVALSISSADEINIKNNHIRNATDGLYVEDYISNSTISNNIIGDADKSKSIGSHGIYISGGMGSLNDTIANNEIFNVTSNYDVYGMYLNGLGNSVIERNNIHDIFTSLTSANGMSIYPDTTCNITIKNNTVRHIAAMGNVTGIELNLSSLYNVLDSSIFIYHNSVYLSPDSVNGLGDYYASAKGISIQNYNGVTNRIDFRNNIISVSLGELTAGADFSAGYAMYIPEYFNPFNTIDNNVYYVSGFDTNAVAYYNYDTLDLAGWQTIVNMDTLSNYANPKFVSATNVQLAYNSPAIDAGVDVGVTSDFNKKARIGLPDIGAFEFEGLAISSATPNISLCEGEGATLEATSTVLANFEWQLSTDGIVYDSILSNVSGVQTGSYNIPATTALMNGYKYRSIVSAEGQQNDTTAAILLTVNPIITNAITQNICNGDKFYFGGDSLGLSGTYKDTIPSLVSGCDSIVTLTLIVNPLLDSTLFVSICEGTKYAFRGDSLGLSGTYKDTIPSLLTGCDSIVTLNLMVNPIFNDTINETICMGEFFVFGGDSLGLSGIYKDTIPSVAGCDSIVTLNLIVNPIYNDTINETICQGETYMLGTQSLSLPGTYVEVFPSQLTCDSTVTLFLNVDSLPKKPNVPVGPIIVDNSIGSSDYMIIPTLYADTYAWSILPVEAGIILSTEASATVTWSSNYTGVASIKVKGINFCGEGVSSDSLNVTVTALPFAQFTYTIDSLKVGFTSQSSNASLYNWSFGDGNFSQIENPLHTYKTAGYYLVCLNVFNLATNQTSDTCMEIQVGNPLELCNAQFSINVQGDSVLFENTSSGEITDVFWDFGDGYYSDSLNNVWHTYTKPNYYEIILTVFNSETGCIDKERKIAKVIFDNAVLCDAQFSYFIDTNNVSFTSVSEGDITDYFWDFGDGTYSFEESPVHVFTEQGYFEVTLTTYSSITNCIDEVSQVVFIFNPLVASCNASFAFYPKGNTVSFTSEATGAYSQHFWDFGNGFNSNIENPVHTFSKAGYYEVVYTVIDTTNGCFDSRSQLIFVEGATGGGNTKAEISAKYSYVPNKDTYEIKFKDESKGEITSWYWNFGDNTPASTVQHPVYVYDTNDYYRVCLTAGNSINQKTKCKFIAVGDVKNKSTAFFTYFADTATATGHFKDKSLGNIASWYWDFGDGNTSTQKNPSHTYIDKGYYAVCLTTTSASGVQKTYCNDVRIDNSIDNPCLFSCVWPGDANNDLEANHYDIMTIGLNYGMKGPKRDSATIAWYGQFAQNWSTYQLDGTNNKYGDANGDGAINLDDVEAIKQNFAFSHYRQPDTKNAEWAITCVWDKENSKRAGSRSKATAQLSPPAKGKASGIYAIGYEIAVIGGEKIKWDSVTVNFDKSWIGEDGVSMLTVSSMDTNRYIIYIGMTRIDQQNITGSGTIADISFKFKDDVDESGVSFVVTSKGGIEYTGKTTSVDGTIELVVKSPVAICEGEAGVIDVGAGFASYTWSNGISDTSFIEVSEAGSYSVTVTDESGATAFATIEVVVNELPVVNLGTDISQDGSVELDAGSGFESYLWSTDAETQTITVSESGDYFVQVSNEFGCFGADTINITITDIKLELTNQIAVYPNPNNGKFWLVYDFSKTATHKVEIINVEGKTVWQTEFIEPNTKSNRIEVDNLEKGVYYLKVVEDSNVGLVRFVVM